MEKQNSFDRLIIGITPEERKKLLEKVSAVNGNSENEVLSPDSFGIQDVIAVDALLKDESILVKIWLWIKSLFTNIKVETLYNEMRLDDLSKKLSKRYPGLVDKRTSQLRNNFYEKLQQLKLAADFFKPYTDSIENDYNSFLIFLGSMMMSDTASLIEENVDPFSNKLAAGAKPEIRAQHLKKMDEILSSIPEKEKRDMYEAVRCIEWMSQFTRLPFIKFLSAFGDLGNLNFACSFGTIDSEFAAFARVLCNAGNVPVKTLEVMSLFTKRFADVNCEVTDDFDTLPDNEEDFAEKADAQLSLIKMFTTTVPMKSIGCIVFSDPHWQPASMTGGEDWFIKYKAESKSVFDSKWEAWSYTCRKESIRKLMENSFGLAKFPNLPERPWVGMWGSLSYTYELTAGFIYWFYTEKFPQIETVLKSIMVEGVFIKKDNRLAFTDTYNDFIQNAINIKDMNSKLRPNGDAGSVLIKIKNERVKTLVSKTKAEQIIHNFEDIFMNILGKFGDSSRLMSLLLGGILCISSDKHYESIANLAAMRGNEDKDFLALVSETKMNIDAALNLVKELESLDAHR